MFIHVIINGAVEQEKLEYLGMLQVEQVKALNEETELWVVRIPLYPEGN